MKFLKQTKHLIFTHINSNIIYVFIGLTKWYPSPADVENEKKKLFEFADSHSAISR